MHNIYDCVESFASLLDTEYHLVLGRKGISVSLDISFDKRDCFHLMGLQYLTDKPELRSDRGKIFDQIRERKITKDKIESSDLYGKIADRIKMLPFLEELLDSNETIFKYNQKANLFSKIQADYLLKNKIYNQNIFIFLSKIPSKDQYFCRSFFPETTQDYTRNQPQWTLLYKEKIKKSEKSTILLYDRLRKTDITDSSK